MKKIYYKVISCVLLSVLVCSVSIAQKRYLELANENKDLLRLVEENQRSYANIVSYWQDRYKVLQDNYTERVSECEKLTEQLNEVRLEEYSFSSSEIEMLAKCVQCEAGVKNEQAQKYVAAVILNRLKSGSFPNTLEGVIYQKNNGVPQFSVAYNGSMDSCNLSPEVLSNVYSVIVCGTDLPEYVLYFYSLSLAENSWTKSLNVYDVVSGTVFAYRTKVTEV